MVVGIEEVLVVFGPERLGGLARADDLPVFLARSDRERRDPDVRARPGASRPSTSAASKPPPSVMPTCSYVWIWRCTVSRSASRTTATCSLARAMHHFAQRSPVGRHARGAVAVLQHVAALERAHARQKRASAERILGGQVVLDGGAVGLPGEVSEGEQRLVLAGESESAPEHRVEQALVADLVHRQHEPIGSLAQGDARMSRAAPPGPRGPAARTARETQRRHPERSSRSPLAVRSSTSNGRCDAWPRIHARRRAPHPLEPAPVGDLVPHGLHLGQRSLRRRYRRSRPSTRSVSGVRLDATGSRPALRNGVPAKPVRAIMMRGDTLAGNCKKRNFRPLPRP